MLPLISRNNRIKPNPIAKVVNLDYLILKFILNCVEFNQSKNPDEQNFFLITSVIVEYFNRNGAPIYASAINMSKAFDLVL